MNRIIIVLLLCAATSWAQPELKIITIQGEKFATDQGKASGIAIGQYYDIFWQGEKIGTAQVIALRDSKSVLKIIKSNDIIEIGDLLRLNNNFDKQRHFKESLLAVGVVLTAAGVAVTYDGLQSQDYSLTNKNVKKVSGGSVLAMAGLIFFSRGLKK